MWSVSGQQVVNGYTCSGRGRTADVLRDAVLHVVLRAKRQRVEVLHDLASQSTVPESPLVSHHPPVHTYMYTEPLHYHNHTDYSMPVGLTRQSGCIIRKRIYIYK